MDKPDSSKHYRSKFHTQLLLYGTPLEVTNPELLIHTVSCCKTSPDIAHKLIVGHMFTQMSGKQGIKKHRQATIDALTQKFLQLDSKGIFKPVSVTDLDEQDRKFALWTITLVKEKHDGRLKGHAVADGHPQCTLYPREEMASSIVSTDALFFSLINVAFKQQNVAIADVVSAYLNTYMVNNVLV